MNFINFSAIEETQDGYPYKTIPLDLQIEIDIYQQMAINGIINVEGELIIAGELCLF
jgi:hypothetical protein